MRTDREDRRREPPGFRENWRDAWTGLAVLLLGTLLVAAVGGVVVALLTR